jgi:hypothetical protein
VVFKIIEGIENKGHVVVVDNYFTGHGFFNKSWIKEFTS